ncbi:MAG: FIST C-terminal domain-containing protein, partial [Bacteroidales bacterium]|nr:FIST C-terminal domain-containing protein [Bacteroidales bacterium]
MESHTDKDFTPGLAFVFATPRQSMHEISRAFSEYDLHIIGCSTGGNILVSDTENAIYENSTVVTLVELNKKHFAYLCRRREGKSSFDLGKEIGKWGLEKFKKPSFIVVASGLSLNGQEYVEGIMDSAGQDIIMFGGLAGDESNFKQNYVFSGQEVLENGSIAIAFDSDQIDIKGIATSGWVGLGKDLTITSSESNIVYSIDNEPALKVYKEYLNVEDSDLPAIGVEYPLLIKRSDNSYALRAVMGVDREKEALIFAGSVPQDATVS